MWTEKQPASHDRVPVAVVALVSRVVVLAWSAACAAIAPPYDSSNSLLWGAEPPTRGDAWVEAALGHTANWDGVYFTEVARVGYTAEHQHAFFPGLPVALNVLR